MMTPKTRIRSGLLPALTLFLAALFTGIPAATAGPEDAIPELLQAYCQAVATKDLNAAAAEAARLLQPDMLPATSAALDPINVYDLPMNSENNVRTGLFLLALKSGIDSTLRGESDQADVNAVLREFGSLSAEGRAAWLQNHSVREMIRTAVYWRLWSEYRDTPFSIPLFALCCERLPEDRRAAVQCCELLRLGADGRRSSEEYAAIMDAMMQSRFPMPQWLYQSLRPELDAMTGPRRAKLLDLLCVLGQADSVNLCLPFLNDDEPAMRKTVIARLHQSLQRVPWDAVESALSKATDASRDELFHLLFAMDRSKALALLNGRLADAKETELPLLLSLALEFGAPSAVETCCAKYALLTPDTRAALNKILLEEARIPDIRAMLAALPDEPASAVANDALALCLELVRTYSLYMPAFRTMHKPSMTLTSTLPPSRAAMTFDTCQETSLVALNGGAVGLRFDKPYRLCMLEFLIDSDSTLSVSHKTEGREVLDYDDLTLTLNTALTNREYSYGNQLQASSDTIQPLAITGMADELTLSFHRGRPASLREVIVHTLDDNDALIPLLRRWAERELPPTEALNDKSWINAVKALNRLNFNVEWTAHSGDEDTFNKSLETLERHCPGTQFLAFFRLKCFYLVKKLPLPAHHEADLLLQADPYEFEAWYSKGLIESKLRKDNAAAAGFFEKAIDLQPENLSLVLAQAETLYQLKENEKALRCFQDLSLMKPRNSLYYNRTGILLMRLERNREAELLYRGQISQGEDGTPRYNLACALAKQKLVDEAVANLRIAIKHEPKRFTFDKVNGDSDFDRIRQSEQFQAVLTEIEPKGEE